MEYRIWTSACLFLLSLSSALCAHASQATPAEHYWSLLKKQE